MDKPPYVLLAQLENQLIRKKISLEDYKDQKFEILLQIKAAGETIIPPTFRDKHSREITDSQRSPFCYIPSSPFIFGEEDAYGEVGFGIYMGKYPVTVREFLNFVEESGWDYPEEDEERMWELCPEERCPVSNVSWLDAKQYCRWLREKTGEYYSLPNEEEWEYASRGIDGRMYPWGNQPPAADSGCFQGFHEYHSTVPVGSYPGNASPFGCLDMVGNVWEWCVDEFDEPEECRILRGGSWCDTADSATCISRISSQPLDLRVDFGGFRVLYLTEKMFAEYLETTEDSGEAEVESTGLKKIADAPLEE